MRIRCVTICCREFIKCLERSLTRSNRLLLLSKVHQWSAARVAAAALWPPQPSAVLCVTGPHLSVMLNYPSSSRGQEPTSVMLSTVPSSQHQLCLTQEILKKCRWVQSRMKYKKEEMSKANATQEGGEPRGPWVMLRHLYLLHIYTWPFHFICVMVKPRQTWWVSSSRIMRIRLCNHIFGRRLPPHLGFQNLAKYWMHTKE